MAAWVTHWDTENGRDGRECYTGVVKTDPFYRLEKKEALRNHLSWDTKKTKTERRGQRHGLEAPLGLFPQISKA